MLDIKFVKELIAKFRAKPKTKKEKEKLEKFMRVGKRRK